MWGLWQVAQVIRRPVPSGSSSGTAGIAAVSVTVWRTPPG